MAPSTSSLFFIILLHLLLLISESSSCPSSFNCSGLGSLEFPLSINTSPSCGLFTVNCTASPHPLVQLKAGDTWYEILEKISSNKLRIRDSELQENLSKKNCWSLLKFNLSVPTNPSTSFTISPNLTLFFCRNEPHSHETNEHFLSHRCLDAIAVYYKDPDKTSAVKESAKPNKDCWKQVTLPRNPNQHNSSDLFSLLTADFTVEWNISDNCTGCHQRGRQCDTNYMNEFSCSGEPQIPRPSPSESEESQTPGPSPNQNPGGPQLTLKLALGIGGSVLFLICFLLLLIFMLWRSKKRLKDSYRVSSVPSSSKPNITDMGGSFYYGIPLFSNDELEEATNNFDPSKELGDGGFGTVYHGILVDGREVAIKRLYEKNYYKRVEQFMNEIKILTCLKHQNLVTLYGCTSRRSRELLLVYEYIPNGTVADHLHGERAKEELLPWSVRMNIAIETASALAYLHKSDIVHRDVKTNNILLDNNFCVKVADFGLSRLFPTDVTHISTAPQGTPGYVDPEYHQCYQLTEKSDVYSFGVVLIELISSKPAVDITRHKYEINLANLALNRIQRRAFDELIDESLGYKIDAEIFRMTTSVAELAFQCLQLEKDMRPSMDEVLRFLREVKKCDPGNIPPSPETDEIELLKNKNLESSPVSITEAWSSGSTTTSSTG